jgi:hypothetical protein
MHNLKLLETDFDTFAFRKLYLDFENSFVLYMNKSREKARPFKIVFTLNNGQ